MQDTDDDARVAWERSFRQQMIRLRDSKQMTQTDLARDLKQTYGLPFHQQTIQRIESGERPIRLNEAFLIAKTLGVSLDTMTSSAGPSDLELRQLVDLLRWSARANGDEVGALIDDFLESFDLLVSAIVEKEPDVETTEFADFDPVIRWTVDFAYRARDALVVALDLRQKLLSLAGVEAETELAFPVPSLDAIEGYTDKFVNDPARRDTGTTDPESTNALYKAFPGRDDGEH